MARRRVLADGLITIDSHVDGARVDVRVGVRPQRRHPRLPIVTSGPILTWARWFLAPEIERMLAAQVEVLRADAGRDIVFDDDRDDVVEVQDTARIVELLERATADAFVSMLRSPDVTDAIIQIVGGDDRSLTRRLQQVIRRRTAARRGAPKKSAADRGDVRTALAVDAQEERIAEAFAFVKSLDARHRRNPQAALARKFEIDPIVADILARSRSRRHAAEQIVAHRDGREPDSVKRAAARGRKHLRALSSE